MKRLALLLFLGALASAGFVRLQPAGDAVSPVYVDNELQHVLVPPTDSTSPAGDNGGVVGVPSGGLNLADVLTVERRASLWWDYARDVASVTSALTRKGDANTTTLLVPVDRAIMALPRKPHQNADGSVTSDKQFQANVLAFLSAHIVPGPLVPDTKTQTLNKDVSVTLTGEDGAWVVQPGDIAVLGVTEASNGKIYYLDGVVSF